MVEFKINKDQIQMLVVLTLVFVIVSLNQTYDITRSTLKLGNLVKQEDSSSYGTGNTFSNYGFVLHIVVFALIVYLLMVFKVAK